MDILCKYGSAVGHLTYRRLSGSGAASIGMIVRDNIRIAMAIHTLNPVHPYRNPTVPAIQD